MTAIVVDQFVDALTTIVGTIQEAESSDSDIVLQALYHESNRRILHRVFALDLLKPDHDTE